ncbi:MAG: Hsp20 family protein [bacterium]|nr:Hsp20 family protein [bacterium]
MNLVPSRWHNPAEEFARDMDRFFSNWMRDDMRGRDPLRGDFFAPFRRIESGVAVDVSETDNEVHVRAEVPGMDKDHIHIEIAGDRLTLRGDKRQEHKHDERGIHVLECSYGTFQRIIPLPVEVESETANATYKDGVLEITLPKAEHAKPRAVEVKVN